MDGGDSRETRMQLIAPKAAAPGKRRVFRPDFDNRDAVVDLALLPVQSNPLRREPPLPYAFRRQWLQLSSLLLPRVRSPNLLDGFFGIEPVRAGVASSVGPIPAGAAAISARGYHAAAGHLEMTVGIIFPDPIPRIVKPLVALRFREN